VKRKAIIAAAVATVVLAGVAGLWFWKHTRMAVLTPAELAPVVHAPPPPPRLRDDCPDVMHALAASSSGPDRGKPKENRSPLSEDELAIYKAVLQRRLFEGWTSLNVSAKTYPLDATSHRSELDCECLQDIYLEESSLAFHSFHRLTRDILPGKRMRLVDPETQAATVRANDPGRTMGEKTVKQAVRDAFATGLFSLSEIAFDRDHRYAVVSYSFWCGMLCGNGATLVLEKIGGEWKITDRQCGGWIS
jgi:hypothetical protein